MAMQPVESSQIAAVGFDEESFTLDVEFKRGGLYRYFDVSPEVFDDLLKAGSVGSFFGKEIKGKYRFEKLGAPAKPTAVADKVESSEPVVEMPDDPQELKQHAITFSAEIRALVINTPEHYIQAAEDLKRVAAAKKAAQERVDRIKKPAYLTYQEALALEKDVLNPIIAAETYLKGGIATYRQEEERRRRAAERLLQQEAQRVADAEARKRADDLALRDAAIAEAQGDPEKAEEILMAPRDVVPAFVPPVVLQKEVPQVEGISSSKKWTFRITDETLIPRQYLMVNEPAIRSVVKALKQNTQIPGVEVYSEDSVRVRA